MEAVAEWFRHRIVAPVYVGSNPTCFPKIKLLWIWIKNSQKDS